MIHLSIPLTYIFKNVNIEEIVKADDNDQFERESVSYKYGKFQGMGQITIRISHKRNIVFF